MKFAPNENVLRVTLLVMSICFGMLSISLIALGIAHVDEIRWPKPYLALDFMELPTLVIILGSISLVLSFVGCFCAKSYNKIIYLLFGTVLCIILCLEITIAVIAFKNTGEPRRSRTEFLMEKHFLINGTDYYFRTLEEHYKCCGIKTGDGKRCPSKAIGCADTINEMLDQIALGIGYSTIVFSCLQMLYMVCVFTICFATGM
ncbi:hypothetical protein JTB14_032683 [Gonioctena quinquepunctata]|nr:hypothetical protein JTB14_032683 [Gonioctena quinquepunctata]